MYIPLVSDVFGWLIRFLHSFIGNYGWAVIVFTLLVKLLVMPLDLKQRRSMKKMAEVQPKLEALKKKYKDPEKLNQKTMELYKEEKLNPLGGCLPMLVQFIIIFGVFAVLRIIAAEQSLAMIQTVEAGQVWQPESWLWIKNIFQPDSFIDISYYVGHLGDLLRGAVSYVPQAVVPDSVTQLGIFVSSHSAMLTQSAIDAAAANYSTVMNSTIAQYAGQVNGYLILPALALVSQIFSMKFMMANQPAGNESMAKQNKIMQYVMMVFFVWFCATTNAAFALYYTISNVWTMVQYIIMDVIDKRKKAKAAEEGVQQA